MKSLYLRIWVQNKLMFPILNGTLLYSLFFSSLELDLHLHRIWGLWSYSTLIAKFIFSISCRSQCRYGFDWSHILHNSHSCYYIRYCAIVTWHCYWVIHRNNWNVLFTHIFTISTFKSRRLASWLISLFWF